MGSNKHRTGRKRFLPEDVVSLILLDGSGLNCVGESESLGAELGVGSVVGLVASVGDPGGDAEPTVRVLVLLLVSGQAIHSGCEKT